MRPDACAAPSSWSRPKKRRETPRRWPRRRGRARGARARSLPDRTALELTARLELRGVDWSRTQAFGQPADNQGYICIGQPHPR
jgi:hypothetical protein